MKTFGFKTNLFQNIYFVLIFILSRDLRVNKLQAFTNLNQYQVCHIGLGLFSLFANVDTIHNSVYNSWNFK